MIVIRAVIRINDGEVNSARAAMTTVTERSVKRKGVLGYDFFRLDDDHVIVIEVYDSSETLLAHINAGGFDELFAVTSVESLEIYGDPSDDARALFLAVGEPRILGSFTK